SSLLFDLIFYLQVAALLDVPLAFSCAKLWQPCQMPSTRRGLLIWLKLFWKPSANIAYLGIPEKFLPNSLAF
ncbi:hypothetical protein DW657_17295, partial [Prevotella sp. AM23-5]